MKNKKDQAQVALKTDILVMLLPTELKNKIRILAKNEDRSLSNYCGHILENFVKNKEVKP